MPEDVCGDVARELLKHLMVASGFHKDPVAVVRAFKAFRATNKTFRNVFDEDHLGCLVLCRYMVWLHNGTTKRRDAIIRFLRMRHRAEGGPSRSSTSRKASCWISGLRSALEQDMGNYNRFISTLRYVLDGNVIRDLAVYHRAMLPLHHPESISRSHGGLPRAAYHLSPAQNPDGDCAPYGTTRWAEDLVYGALPNTHNRRQLAEKTVKALFQIQSEEDSPAKKRHDRWARENLGIEWTKVLEEQLSEMELNVTAALNAQ